MKFTIERAPLLAALAGVHSIVPKKSTIPILGNLRLEVTEDGRTLLVTGTDLDMAATARVECEGEPGATTIPADRLYEIVRALPDGADLDFDGVNPTRAILRAGRSRFQLGQLPASDFPRMAGGAMDLSFTIGAGPLLRLLTLGGSCFDTADSRDYLKCVYLHADQGELAAVSTDGSKRVIRTRLPLPDGADGLKSMIAPTPHAAILRLLANERPERDVTICASRPMIVFEIGSTVLTSKLLDDSTPYPDYWRIIPKEFKAEVTADTDLFTGALNRSMIIASSNVARRVRVECGEDSLRMHATAGDSDEAEEEVDIELKGDAPSFSMDGKLLGSMLALVRTESAVLKIASTGPGVVIGETDPASDWLGVVATQGVEA
jgi:DNA polymerase-3 subunit beta